MRYKDLVKLAEGAKVVKDYIYIKCNGKLIPEHRLVAEKALGRPLSKFHIVHHVDENKHNNAPSNLVICPSHQYHAHLHNLMIERDADYEVLAQNPWLMELA
jgi:hypothetical protein